MPPKKSDRKPKQNKPPSNRTSNPDIPKRPIKRKKRAIKSCIQCRQKKLACDKGTPCGRCQKSGDNCVYISNPEELENAPKRVVKRRSRNVNVCLRCRSRHLSCNKGSPCSNCKKEGVECKYIRTPRILTPEELGSPSSSSGPTGPSSSQSGSHSGLDSGVPRAYPQAWSGERRGSIPNIPSPEEPATSRQHHLSKRDDNPYGLSNRRQPPLLRRAPPPLLPLPHHPDANLNVIQGFNRATSAFSSYWQAQQVGYPPGPAPGYPPSFAPPTPGYPPLTPTTMASRHLPAPTSRDLYNPSPYMPPPSPYMPLSSAAPSLYLPPSPAGPPPHISPSLARPPPSRAPGQAQFPPPPYSPRDPRFPYWQPPSSGGEE